MHAVSPITQIPPNTVRTVFTVKLTDISLKTGGLIKDMVWFIN